MADVSVTVGDELDAFVRRTLDRLAPGLLPRIEREAREIKDNAVAQWPVGRERYGGTDGPKGRPHSRDLFRVETEVTPDFLIVRIVNSAPYFFQIRTDWDLSVRGRSPFSELIRKPVRARLPRLVDDLRDELARLAGRV